MRVEVPMKRQPKNRIVNVDGEFYDADCINPGKLLKTPKVTWHVECDVDGKWFWVAIVG